VNRTVDGRSEYGLCRAATPTVERSRKRVSGSVKHWVSSSTMQRQRIADDVRLPKSIQRRVQAAKRLREKVTREEREMVVAQRRAVSAMRRLNLGHRDAGQLLDVSFQRAQQLERIPEMHGAIIERASRTGHSSHLGAKRAARSVERHRKKGAYSRKPTRNRPVLCCGCGAGCRHWQQPFAWRQHERQSARSAESSSRSAFTWVEVGTPPVCLTSATFSRDEASSLL
jgi:hypothetical protein